MLESAPFNLRRLIIWVGRLVLGGIFIYAGIAKLTMPNSHLWPYIFLKMSVSTNLNMFQTQVESYKMLSPEAAGILARTLPFVEIIIGLMLLIGWRLKIWATLVTLIMFGFLGVVTRAYLLHMDINCGCFGTPEKLTGMTIVRDAAICFLALIMTYFVFTEARPPHPWAAASAPEKA
jgi:putative oxidoreductase